MSLMHRHHGALLKTGLCVFAVLIGLVIDKEVKLYKSKEYLFELAPVDPRSLMQGDYMVLNYKLSSDASNAVVRHKSISHAGTLRVVVRVDQDNVVHFSRLDDGTPLDGTNEILMKLKASTGRSAYDFGLNSFFFEEGMGKRFARAKYGLVKRASDGTLILQGLCGADKKQIR